MQNGSVSPSQATIWCTAILIQHSYCLLMPLWDGIIWSQASLGFCFFPRGLRWWTRFSTQSASPTAWRSSRWRTQGSNRRFPLPWHLLLVESNFLSHLLLAPVAPLCHTLPLLLSPFQLTSHLPSAAILTSASSVSPPFSLLLSSLSLRTFVQ